MHLLANHALDRVFFDALLNALLLEGIQTTLKRDGLGRFLRRDDVQEHLRLVLVHLDQDDELGGLLIAEVLEVPGGVLENFQQGFR